MANTLSKKTDYKGIVGNLSLAGDPIEWNDFLFEIQNQLISHGHLKDLNEKATEDFAAKFQCLNDFFKDLRNVKSQKN